VVDAATSGGQLTSGGAPLGRLLVVDDMVGAELLEDLDLVGGRCGGDDLCACGFGELA